MKHHFSWLLQTFFLIFANSVIAQNDIFYQLQFSAKNQEERSAIADVVPIDNINGDSVYSLVDEDEYLKATTSLPQMIIRAEAIENPFSIEEPEIMASEFPAGYEAYHTYDEMISEIDKRLDSGILQKFSLGKSFEGKELWGVKIAGRSVDDQTPALVLVATHHAREHLSTETALLYIDYLVKGYGHNPEVTNLVDSRNIYIVPMLNPDGAMYDIKNRRFNMWRKNRRGDQTHVFGVDLNRNYGYQWGTGGSSSDESEETYMGPTAFSEPETVAFKSFIESHPNVKMILSLHTYSELILYPWGYSDTPIEPNAQNVYSTMASDMAHMNNYKPMHAFDLYQASGDTCDWAWSRGIFCFTFELYPSHYDFFSGFYPKPEWIQPTFDNNVKAFLYLTNYSDDPYRVIHTH